MITWTLVMNLVLFLGMAFIGILSKQEKPEDHYYKVICTLMGLAWASIQVVSLYCLYQ